MIAPGPVVFSCGCRAEIIVDELHLWACAPAHNDALADLSAIVAASMGIPHEVRHDGPHETATIEGGGSGENEVEEIPHGVRSAGDNGRRVCVDRGRRSADRRPPLDPAGSRVGTVAGAAANLAADQNAKIAALYSDPFARCRECGCSNQFACPGGCSWVEITAAGPLCSTCALIFDVFVWPPTEGGD